VPFALVAPDSRPILRSHAVIKNWQMASFPHVHKLAAQNGFGTVDLLILNSIYQPFWLAEIRHKKSVYRAADLSAGFPGSGEALIRVETEIVRQVDHVVAAANTLVEPLKKMGARSVIRLPNGIDLSLFSAGGCLPPSEYDQISRPIAVYVGAFDIWFDADLISFCAEKLPDVSFVMIGDAETLGRHRVRSLRNVHFLGTRARSEVPAYLQHADVGLIPFDRMRCPELIDHVNPLKLYEYCACGLPVVSTSWAEMRGFDHPATLCVTDAEFLDGLTAALDRPPHTDELIQFAKSVDWAPKIEHMLRTIGF
jgi:glycosyltransferase involved in cell wall biosynthesis